MTEVTPAIVEIVKEDTANAESEDSIACAPAPAVVKDPRAYRNIQPSSNKIVAMKWDDWNRRIHAERLEKIKPGIDNRPPKTYPHLVVRLKKIQKEQDRRSLIQRDNQTLIKKMTAIIHQKPFVPKTKKRNVTKQEDGKREQQLRRIHEENKAILQRIERKAAPSPRQVTWQSERLVNLHYLVNIAKYPNKFIHEKHQLSKLQNRRKKVEERKEEQEEKTKDSNVIDNVESKQADSKPEMPEEPKKVDSRQSDVKQVDVKQVDAKANVVKQTTSTKQHQAKKDSKDEKLIQNQHRKSYSKDSKHVKVQEPKTKK